MSKDILYDIIYDTGKNLFNKHNVCDIKNGTCFAMRNNPDKKEKFCCSGCEYLTEIGCSVKSIGCKIWICNTIRTERNLPKSFYSVLGIIRSIAYKHGFLGFRMSKKDIFNFLEKQNKFQKGLN